MLRWRVCTFEDLTREFLATLQFLEEGQINVFPIMQPLFLDREK